jgi:hypothetical protein
MKFRIYCKRLIISSLAISLLLTGSLLSMESMESTGQTPPSALKKVEGPDDFMEVSKKAIPARPFTYIAVSEIYSPLLLLNSKKIFEAYFKIMFNPLFPPPVHNDTVILGGYQCLYRKLSFALTLENKEQQEEYQLEAIYSLLAFHKKSIGKFDQELADKIPGFACEDCKRTAKLDLGIAHDSYK